jgi:dihydrofolate reductase
MTSLDGFVAGPNNDLGWALIDEEIHSFVNEREKSVPVCLYGRRMYEMMRYWQTPEAVADRPQYEKEFAEIWRAQRRIVFSTTLHDVVSNTRIERLVDFDGIRRLKAETRGDLTVAGPTLASQFINAGLVDEYQLYQHPVVIGEGSPFFKDINRRIELELVEQHRFASGVVFLRYAPRNREK